MKYCSDISELEYNLRNCLELGKKLLETKKVDRNTRSCQKVAEQLVESTRFGRGNRGRKAGVRYNRQREGAEGGRWQVAVLPREAGVLVLLPPPSHV